MADDPVDSWEDLEDNGELDKQLQNLVPSQNSNRESSKQSDGVVAPVPTLQEDNGGRTAYKPSVRILKRDQNASGPGTPGYSARPAQSKPIRTLEEREAAYAEARLRILGSADGSSDSNLNNGETNSGADGSVASSSTPSSEPSSSTVESGTTAEDSSQSNR